MTVVVAGLLDWLVGEPPRRFHPVVAMGTLLEHSGRWARSRRRPAGQLVAGALAWLTGAAATLAVAGALEGWARRRPWWMAVLSRGVALSTLHAGRMLHDEVAGVEAALARGVPAGRDAVGRLVSRDVTALDESGVRQAALESLAENVSDSVTAPLLAYALAGLPGAALYRYSNTADAMWGYRGDWEWAGKVAARLDDLANLVPARATALLLARLPFDRPAARWRDMRREARRTPSPNAGHPMAALALRLGVRLQKPGVYVLNPVARPPSSADTTAALRLVRAVIATVLLAAAIADSVRRPIAGARA